MNKKLKKLTLSTETLRNLDEPDLKQVAGGTVANSGCTAACSECTLACSCRTIC
jgi:natural product precursor